MTGSEAKAREILLAAGIVPNGPNPWDPQELDPRVYDRIMSGGSIAAGESYMDGWWEVSDLSSFFDRILSAELQRKFPVSLEMLWYFARARFANLQSRARAKQVAEVHYDLGNDLYERMLGPSMVYTCGYWKDTDDLTIAQYNKLDLVCKKIGLKKGDRVLDIGCGFGAFAKFAAERYGAIVTGVSVSKEQCAFAKDFVGRLPVEICLQDYRDTEGQFDHVVSIGMFEAVGYKNFREFMTKVHSLLKPGGLFLLHTIGSPVTAHTSDAWFDKYIFPNGHLPSVAQIGTSIERLFIMEDWHNFGADYDKTLMAWWKNFDEHWPELKDKYGERFYRMWRYYLMSVAGSFRCRASNQLWQIVLSKGGVRGGYTTVR